jgi:hemoglobin-like flavoprotein
MGGTSSTLQTTKEASARVASISRQSAATATVADREAEITKFVLPIYYSNLPPSNEEFTAAYDAWKLILNNRSPHFLSKKAADPTFMFENCNEYFFHVFYNRFFDIHPDVRVLFTKPINKQGSFLLRFITMCLDAWNDQEKWDKNLINLTNIHNKMGIKAVEYGINGEVLFYTLRECLGSGYTDIAHRGWVKIYSRMLITIVPRVVRFELANTEAAQEISKARNTREASVAVFTTKTGNESSVVARTPSST